MRALIFTDVNSAVSARLIRTTLDLARTRGDFTVCGIVTSRPERFQLDRAREALSLFRRLLVAATNRDVPFATVPAATIDLARLEREHGIPLIVPDGGDPNDARFIRRLSSDVRPQVALSFDCLTIFRRPLLSIFEHAVNYHSGSLAVYRGVMATAFSVLAGETESGFTFHRMVERVDAGPILVEGAVRVDGSTAAHVEHRKLEKAVASLPRVIDAIFANEPGKTIDGLARPFRIHDWEALIRVDRPDLVTAAQLRRRVRAFGVIHLTIDGIEHAATRLRIATPGQARSFRTLDGVLMAPDRFEGLPRLLHELSSRSVRRGTTRR